LQQIQEFLNKCIKRGWKPRHPRLFRIECLDKEIKVFSLRNYTTYSYHDLFSVESWLMEFVKWYEYSKKEYLYIPYEKMSVMTAEKKN